MTFGGYLYADLANGRVRLILSHTSEGFYSLISQGNFGGPRGVQRVAGSSSISSTLRFNLWVPSGEIWTKGLGTASEGGNHPLHFWIRLFDRTGIENEDDAVGHVCIAGPGSGVCPRLVGSHGSHWFQHHVRWSDPGQSELHERSRVRGEQRGVGSHQSARTRLLRRRTSPTPFKSSVAATSPQTKFGSTSTISRRASANRACLRPSFPSCNRMSIFA